MKDNGFSVGFKRGLVKKTVKKKFGNRFNKGLWTTKVLKDISYFNEDVLDVLIIGNPNTREDFEKLVNAHLDLEYRIHKETIESINSVLSEERKVKFEKLIYIPGNAKTIFCYEG